MEELAQLRADKCDSCETFDLCIYMDDDDEGGKIFVCPKCWVDTVTYPTECIVCGYSVDGSRKDTVWLYWPDGSLRAYRHEDCIDIVSSTM